MERKHLVIFKSLKFVMIAVIMLIAIYIICKCFFGEFIPSTKTDFKSYEEFYNYKGYQSLCFQKELPQSKEDIQYYWHEDFFNKSAGYRVMLSETDYAKMQEKYLSFYREKGVSSSEIYNCEDLSFLKENILKQEEVQNYYFLVCYKVDLMDGYRYEGVILNDNTNEAIEFYHEHLNGT